MSLYTERVLLKGFLIHGNPQEQALIGKGYGPARTVLIRTKMRPEGGFAVKQQAARFATRSNPRFNTLRPQD